MVLPSAVLYLGEALKTPPANNDGVIYVDPNNSNVRLVAYGRHAGVVPGKNDVEWNRECILKKPGAKIMDDRADGGQIEFTAKGKDAKPMLLTRKGWRFQYTYRSEDHHMITVLEKLVLPDRKTLVCISLQAPKKLWPAYEEVFNMLANDLVVLETGYDRN